MNEQYKGEIKKQWKFFLFYGLAILIIGTIIQFELNQWLNSQAQGPPCRIEFSQESFQLNNSTYFNLPYLFVNLRDKDLLIERTEAYCVWSIVKEQNKHDDNFQALNPPSIQKIVPPKEFENFPASQSAIRTAQNCLSSSEVGDYNLKIIVKTTSGTCE